MSLMTPEPSPVASSFLASSYGYAMPPGNCGYGAGLGTMVPITAGTTTTPAALRVSSSSASVPTLNGGSGSNPAMGPTVPVGSQASYAPQRSGQPRGLGRQGGLHLQTQSLGLGFQHQLHHQQQQHQNKFIGPNTSSTQTTTTITTTPSFLAPSPFTPPASSTRSEFEFSTLPPSKLDSFNRLPTVPAPALGLGLGDVARSKSHEDDGDNDDTAIHRLLFDILSDDGEDATAAANATPIGWRHSGGAVREDGTIPTDDALALAHLHGAVIVNGGNRSRSLTVSSSSSLGPIINNFPVPPPHPMIPATVRRPPPLFSLLSPPCSPVVATRNVQMLPRNNAMLKDATHTILDGLPRPPPPLHLPPSQTCISLPPPPLARPPFPFPPAGIAPLSVPNLKAAFPSPPSIPGSTSQCILTPDGKALARDYGPWVTIDVGPISATNSVVLSWPRGFPLPS